MLLQWMLKEELKNLAFVGMNGKAVSQNPLQEIRRKVKFAVFKFPIG